MVLAHFSPWKALGSVAFGYGLLGLILYLSTLPPSPTPTIWDSKPVLWLGLVAGIVFAIMVTAVLVQLVFDQGNALWSDGDRVVYLNRWLISAKRGDIAAASLGSSGFGGRSVVLTLRNGRKKIVPVGTLREPAAEVLDHVNAWLKG